VILILECNVIRFKRRSIGKDQRKFAWEFR
jgi:hypothetical protein